MTASSVQGQLLAGRYRLCSSLGRGGMGTVWQARDELLKRDVAVKEVRLPEELTAAEREVLCQRLIREARAAARLNHPGVVTVHDVLEEADRPWIVMEFVDARSLSQIVREDGPMSAERVIEVGLQLLAALQAAHAAGVLHRDVKPGNVLLTSGGRAVLTDFGIAVVEGDPSLTTTGVLLGAPSYIAPERALGEPAARASDLWSLGATLYTAVEGRPPFDAGAPVPTVAAVVRLPPAPLRLAGPLKPVLDALLHKDPGERVSAAAAARMLRQAAAAQPDSAEAQPDSPAAQPDAAEAQPDSPAARPDSPEAQPDSPAAQPDAAAARPRSAERNAVVVGGRGARTRPLFFACVAALLLLAGVVAGSGLLGTEGRGPASPAPPGSGSSAQAPAPSPPLNEPEAPAGPAAEPSPASPPTVAEPAPAQPLPTGFARYVDESGFSVAVPLGWQAVRDGSSVYLREPGSPRFLLIAQTDDPQPDPVADWQRQERARSPGYADYERIRIAPVDYFRAAADWEFTYTRGDERTHVINRGFIIGDDRGYALYWSTPQAQWDDSLGLFTTFVETFQPAD